MDRFNHSEAGEWEGRLVKIDDKTRLKIETLSIEISQEMGKIEAHFRKINELMNDMVSIIEDYNSGP